MTAEPMWAAGAARTGGWEPVRSYDALIEIATQFHAEEFTMRPRYSRLSSSARASC